MKLYHINTISEYIDSNILREKNQVVRAPRILLPSDIKPGETIYIYFLGKMHRGIVVKKYIDKVYVKSRLNEKGVAFPYYYLWKTKDIPAWFEDAKHFTMPKSDIHTLNQLKMLLKTVKTEFYAIIKPKSSFNPIKWNVFKLAKIDWAYSKKCNILTYQYNPGGGYLDYRNKITIARYFQNSPETVLKYHLA